MFVVMKQCVIETEYQGELITITARGESPVVEQQGMTVHYGYMRSPITRTSWNPIPIRLYDDLPASTINFFNEWIQTTFECITGRVGYASEYKKTMMFNYYSDNGQLSSSWKLSGVFMTEMAVLIPKRAVLIEKIDNCALESDHFVFNFDSAQLLM